MTWREDSTRIITQQVAKCGLDDPVAQEKHVRGNYPFNVPRHGFAYKAWLWAVNEYFRPRGPVNCKGARDDGVTGALFSDDERDWRG